MSQKRFGVKSDFLKVIPANYIHFQRNMITPQSNSGTAVKFPNIEPSAPDCSWLYPMGANQGSSSLGWPTVYHCFKKMSCTSQSPFRYKELNENRQAEQLIVEVKTKNQELSESRGGKTSRVNQGISKAKSSRCWKSSGQPPYFVSEKSDQVGICPRSTRVVGGKQWCFHHPLVLFWLLECSDPGAEGNKQLPGCEGTG